MRLRLLDLGQHVLQLLSAGYIIERCEDWGDSRLATLMRSFSEDDPRIGTSKQSGRDTTPSYQHDAHARL